MAAPALIVVSHAAGVGLFASPHWWEGQSDDWAMAGQVDFYGTSFYPKHSALVDRDPAWRAALLDFTRSFAYDEGRRGFWIGELQAGFGTIALNVSPTVTSADLRTWAWSAIARGAKGIAFYAYYPMSTGYESGGFGLVHLDGTPHGAEPRRRRGRANRRRATSNCCSTAVRRPHASRSSTTRWRTSSADGSATRPTAARKARSPASNATPCSAPIARSSRQASTSTTCTPSARPPRRSHAMRSSSCRTR